MPPTNSSRERSSSPSVSASEKLVQCARGSSQNLIRGGHASDEKMGRTPPVLQWTASHCHPYRDCQIWSAVSVLRISSSSTSDSVRGSSRWTGASRAPTWKSQRKDVRVIAGARGVRARAALAVWPECGACSDNTHIRTVALCIFTPHFKSNGHTTTTQTAQPNPKKERARANIFQEHPYLLFSCAQRSARARLLIRSPVQPAHAASPMRAPPRR